MVKLETALGEITISAEVLETIVGRAVNECFGVAGMAAKDSVENLVSLFKRNRLDKGVRVIPAGEDMVSIELHIIVDNGVNLTAVSRSIMSEVRYVVSKTTGVEVRSVDVFVDSMRF